MLFFRDDAADYHLLALDGRSEGYIGTADDTVLLRYWEDGNPGRERGDINHSSVATGDLNGDGYDNEVVTAFKDSGKDLQVVVMRPDSAGATFKSIFYWDSYSGNPKIDTIADTCSSNWSNFRPIDVATGDLDGDFKDEVIVAAREGPCNDNGDIQLLAFDFNPEDASHNLTINTSVSVPRLEVEFDYATYVAAPTVSISAGDLDGDGYGEIALGWMMEWLDKDTSNYIESPMLATYEYVRPNTPEAKQYSASQSQACFRESFRVGNSGSEIGRWTSPRATRSSMRPYRSPPAM